MKKSAIFLSSVLLMILVSCANKESTSTTDVTENWNAKSKAVYKAIETGDVSGLDSIMAKDISEHDMGGVKGIDSVKAMLGDMHNHFSNLKFDVISQANNGDYHFTLIEFNATPKDNYMGMEAGKSYSMKGVDVVRIKDGKATDHWGFTDNAEMMKMMQTMMPARDTVNVKPGGKGSMPE